MESYSLLKQTYVPYHIYIFAQCILQSGAHKPLLSVLISYNFAPYFKPDLRPDLLLMILWVHPEWRHDYFQDNPQMSGVNGMMLLLQIMLTSNHKKQT